MGLFSSKKKTIVGTSVSRLIKDELLPDSVRTGMTRGILQSADLPASIIDELNQGIAQRAEKMYRYSENGYVFGSPSGEYVTNSRGEAELRAVLIALEGVGSTIEFEYLHVGAPNILHIGWLKLVRDHAYNTVTNKLGDLSTTKGVDVFLDDIQVEIPSGTLSQYSGMPLQQWGTSPKRGVSPTRPAVTSSNGLGAMLPRAAVLELVVPDGEEDCARAKYAWTDPVTKEVKKASLRITNMEYDEAATFIQAKYTVTPSGGSPGPSKYFIYELGEGTHPTLDVLLDVPNEEGGNYFPFIHFRSLKTSIGADTESTAYLDSVKMAEKLGFDYVGMLNSIHENPDVGDLEQAFVGLMVPANTENETEQQYLFDFFDRMYESGRSVDPDWAVKINTAGEIGPEELPYLFSEVIQDTRVKTVVVNLGIQKYVKAAAGVPGTYTSGSVAAPAGAKYRRYHFYRRQVSRNIYHEVRVLDLQTRYYVQGDYFAASDGDGANDILMIPVDRSITRTYSMVDREILYSRSLHMVANSLVIQTIKWYQQAFFSTFLQIVGVGLFIYTLGTSSFVSAALAGGATALAVVTAVVQAILIEIATSLALAYTFKLAAQALGADIALLLAVVAAVAAGVSAYQAGSFSKSVTAQAALNVSTGLVKAVGATYTDAMEGIRQEMLAFQSDAETKLESLEDAQSLLDSNLRLDPLVIFGESPDDYYRRTVHSGNIGIIGYAAVHDFVEVALRLPTLSDTVEGFK